MLICTQFSGAGRFLASCWYAVLCGICTRQHAHDSNRGRGLTALTMNGAMLSTSAIPLRILFFRESAYIRRVVNAGVRSSVGLVVVSGMHTDWLIRPDSAGLGPQRARR